MVNVVSLFHGMGCLNIAMNRAGIRTGFVYTSEIDKYATKVDIANNPGNIRMGDVRNWREWGIDWSSVDLVTAGSPCQGFSSAGKQGGTKAVIDGVETVISSREQYVDAKQRGAEFLSQSHLFWEFVLLLDVVRVWNPNVKFMLENVKMSRNNLDMITEALGVEPVFINSEVICPQSRPRYYWCNWGVPAPEPKDINLLDYLVDEGKPMSKGWHTWFEKNREFQLSKQYCAILNNGSTNRAICMTERQYASWNGNFIQMGGGEYRAMTVNEACAMQGVPRGYCNSVSASRAYSMLGNGWQCDTIEHILRYMNGA